MLLLDDGRIVQGVSPETTFRQQPMQVGQRRNRQSRSPKLHAGTGDRVQHPCGQHRDHTGCRFNMNNPTSTAPLTVMPPNSLPIKRVPAVIDCDDVWPDMGRMNGRLRLDGKIISSPGQTPGPKTGRSSRL